MIVYLVLSCWVAQWLSSCVLWAQRIAVITRDGYSSLQLGLKSHLSRSLSELRLAPKDLKLNSGLKIWFTFCFINTRTSLMCYVTHPPCAAQSHNNKTTMSRRTSTALPLVISFASRNYTQGANKRIAKCWIAWCNKHEGPETWLGL